MLSRLCSILENLLGLSSELFAPKIFVWLILKIVYNRKNYSSGKNLLILTFEQINKYLFISWKLSVQAWTLILISDIKLWENKILLTFTDIPAGPKSQNTFYILWRFTPLCNNAATGRSINILSKLWKIFEHCKIQLSCNDFK